MCRIDIVIYFLQIPWDQSDLYFHQNVYLFIEYVGLLLLRICGGIPTSHFMTNASDNLSNIPHFCLGLLSNLENLQRPVDTRLIILDIFGPVLYSEDTFIYSNMVSHWALWLDFK